MKKKLSDCSVVISEVSECSKIQIFRGSDPDPAGGAYSAPVTILRSKIKFLVFHIIVLPNILRTWVLKLGMLNCFFS